MRTQIEIAAKMYKCQTSAKALFGDEYKSRVQVYKNLIEAHKKKFGLEDLHATMELCSLPSVAENGMAVMLFMAAAVELIEPTNP